MSLLDTTYRLLSKVSDALSGPVVPVVLEIAKEVVDLAGEVKGVVNEADGVVLGEKRDELEAKVLAHADSTEATLRGEQE